MTIERVITNQLPIVKSGSHTPVVPCELPNGIQLAYADDCDRRHTIALKDAGAIDFCRAQAFREPPAYRGQHNFPGWWWSATTRSHVVYESWLGRHHIIEADRDARITGIAGLPFTLTWPSGKRQVRHTPDLFCRIFDGGGLVTDCRSAGKVSADFRYRCAVTAAACQIAGWEFRLVGEPDPVWAANLRWLAGYRHPRFADPDLEQKLVCAFTQPRSLIDAAVSTGDSIRVLPVLFHLLWLGRLTGDLSKPLGNATILAASTDLLEVT